MKNAAPKTPKAYGMTYDAKAAVWDGQTDAAIVPPDARTVTDYFGAVWLWWVAGGYQYRRNTMTGRTTANRY